MLMFHEFSGVIFSYSNIDQKMYINDINISYVILHAFASDQWIPFANH